MRLIMYSCPLCDKSITWDSRFTVFFKAYPIPEHTVEKTDGVYYCNGREQGKIYDNARIWKYISKIRGE